MIVGQVRRRIEQERQATRTEIERSDELLKLKADYGLRRGDPTVYSRERNLARRERAKGKLSKLEDALQRMEEGHTGYVEPAVRLSRPSAWQRSPLLLCIACAQQEAQLQLSTAKVYGMFSFDCDFDGNLRRFLRPKIHGEQPGHRLALVQLSHVG